MKWEALTEVVAAARAPGTHGAFQCRCGQPDGTRAVGYDAAHLRYPASGLVRREDGRAHVSGVYRADQRPTLHGKDPMSGGGRGRVTCRARRTQSRPRPVLGCSVRTVAVEYSGDGRVARTGSGCLAGQAAAGCRPPVGVRRWCRRIQPVSPGLVRWLEPRMTVKSDAHLPPLGVDRPVMMSLDTATPGSPHRLPTVGQFATPQCDGPQSGRPDVHRETHTPDHGRSAPSAPHPVARRSCRLTYRGTRSRVSRAATSIYRNRSRAPPW